MPSIVDEPRLIEAVRCIQGRLWVDRLEATIEAHVDGRGPRPRGNRDPRHLGAHDLPLPGQAGDEGSAARRRDSVRPIGGARGTATTSASSSADVGFPIILKPAAGAGASGTERVDSADELDAAIARSGVEHGAEVAVEEFVEGHEGFYDTISIDGRVAMDFATHYYPNVLEAMRTRWISPQFVTTNRIDGPDYRRAAGTRPAGHRHPRHRHLGDAHGMVLRARRGCTSPRSAAARRACGRGTSTPPPTTSTSTASGPTRSSTATCPRPPSRRFSAGIIALRPDQDGTIPGYEGIDEVQQRLGEWVIDTHLPPPGTPTQGVEAGYMANAWVRMRHPDYDTLRGMLDDVGRNVRVRAG